MNNKEWLDSLKPGDRVACVAGGGSHVVLTTVARRTKTLIITKNDYRFRSVDGMSKHDGFVYVFLRPITPELKERAELRKLAAWFNSLKLSTLSPATLRAIKEAYEKSEASNQQGGEQ